MVAPWRVLAERIVEPGLEVDGPRLRYELARVVVDPVTWKRTRANEVVGRRPVRIDRQGQGRPGDRRPDLEIGLPRHGSRHRHSHAPAHSLDEADRRWLDNRLWP